MKTVFSMVAGLAAGAVFAVGQPEVQVVTFSSQGTDTYADGKTTVLDGECYALVWSPDGQFGGIDGSGGARRAGDKVVYIGGFAKGGRCGCVEFHVANGYFTEEERAKGGKFALWVLDTRVFLDGVQKSFGWTDGKGVVSYAAPAAEAAVAASFGAGAPGAITGTGAQAGQSTTDLANLQPPVIEGPYFESDASGARRVRIGLRNTVPGAKYAILGADNVMMTGAKEGVVTTGTGEDLTVIAPDTGEFNCNFYKAVVR